MEPTGPEHPPSPPGQRAGVVPEEVLETARAWRAEGHAVAVATVVRTWGSSPRPAGSQLVADDTGRFEGSVSGGCVEGAVVTAAREVLAGAPARMLAMGVSDETAWGVGLPCGGRVEVYVQPAPDDELLARVAHERAAKRPVVLGTHLPTGVIHMVLPRGDEEGIPAEVRAAASVATRLDASGRPEDAPDWFLKVLNPPLRMVLVGGVHLAQVLATLSRLAGFEVTVVDPRTAFASPARFADVALVHEWPDEALSRLAPDARTAVVTLSHDPKLDEPALTVALASDAFYVGALGSRRTQAARRERLAEAGLTPAQLDRIHGPVGLDIGARTTAEIAVSIMAQVVECLRRPG